MLAGSQHTRMPSPKASDDFLASHQGWMKCIFLNQTLNPVNPVKKNSFLLRMKQF
jgi:hypothetical protein